jgi:hypothetical protein
VAHDSAAERQGVVRPVRWLSRALLVLGGVAAGTAAAWAVSGASASADSMEAPTAGETASITPVTDATAAGLRDATHAAAQFAGDTSGVAAAAWHGAVCQQDATSWSIPSSESGLRPTAPGCSARDKIGGPLREHRAHRVIDEEVSHRVHGAVSDLADNAVIHPVERTLGAVEHIATKPEDAPQVIKDSLAPSPDLGKKVWDLLNQGETGGLLPLPTLPLIPAEPGTGPEIPEIPQNLGDAVDNAKPAIVELPGAAEAQRASRLAGDAAGTTKNSSLHSDKGDFPTPFAPAGLPVAPLSAPTVPGAPGSAPGGHFEGPAYGVPAWYAAVHNNAKAGTLRAGARYMPLTPGSQPGVTPD